jgi:hypothetical protein
MPFIQVYFVVFGLISSCAGVALLINFRDLSKEWEDGLNRNSEYVGKLPPRTLRQRRSLKPKHGGMEYILEKLDEERATW